LWKEAVEPGVITAAAPVNELAPDEATGVPGPNAGILYNGSTYTASEVPTTETGMTGYHTALQSDAGNTITASVSIPRLSVLHLTNNA